jgi:hypothetical protein
LTGAPWGSSAFSEADIKARREQYRVRSGESRDGYPGRS